MPTLAADAGLAVDPRDRIVTDDQLRSITDPRVYAIGDAAAIPGAWGGALAMGCRTSGFTGPYVADLIADQLCGQTEIGVSLSLYARVHQPRPPRRPGPVPAPGRVAEVNPS